MLALVFHIHFLQMLSDIESYLRTCLYGSGETGLARLDEMKFGVFIWKNLVPAHRDVLRYVINKKNVRSKTRNLNVFGNQVSHLCSIFLTRAALGLWEVL